MPTEMITLKLDSKFLKDIDKTVKKENYHNRTEFIRDSVRTKLTELEKQEVIKKLAKFKGSLKGKSKLTDEEAGELAARDVAKKFGIKLN